MLHIKSPPGFSWNKLSRVLYAYNAHRMHEHNHSSGELDKSSIERPARNKKRSACTGCVCAVNIGQPSLTERKKWKRICDCAVWQLPIEVHNFEQTTYKMDTRVPGTDRDRNDNRTCLHSYLSRLPSKPTSSWIQSYFFEKIDPKLSKYIHKNLLPP